ncbi:MAG: DUF1844 domain-containing protein [Armatimonadetes bacterium]|nr:DUF1844 domain-containing protein [Armatimonadota bacterium]
MSENKEPFEGGEAPCRESAIPEGSVEAGGQAGEESTRRHEAGAPDPFGSAGAGPGGRGITMEELNDVLGQVPPEMLAPDLPMLLASMAAMLEEQSWRHLGLVANPVTGKVEKDLQKARIAIDIVAYVTSQVSPLMGEAQRRDLQNRVATLQMNFVEQSNRD